MQGSFQTNNANENKISFGQAACYVNITFNVMNYLPLKIIVLRDTCWKTQHRSPNLEILILELEIHQHFQWGFFQPPFEC